MVLASLLSFGKFTAGRNPAGIFSQHAALPIASLPFPSLPKGGMVVAESSASRFPLLGFSRFAFLDHSFWRCVPGSLGSQRPL